MLGDYENIGLTRQEYRTALKKTENLGIATFRATNEGTIGKLVDTSIYDINADVEQPPGKPTTNHQETNEQPLIRMKERKKERKITPPSPLPPQTAAPAALKESGICSPEQRRALRANLPQSMQEILRAREGGQNDKIDV
jgi:hypothetical protein